jgi:Yip1 domain
MLLQRMLRAAMLDPAVYDDLRRDRSANNQAFTVVGIVAACTLIGYRTLSPGAIFWTGLGVLGNWLFLSMIVMLVANRFGGRAEFDEIVRPLAFAQTPGVLTLFVLVPGWYGPLTVGVWLWQTVALFVAIREVLRLTTREAGLTVLFTMLILAAITVVTGLTFGVFGMMMTQMRHWIGGF